MRKPIGILERWRMKLPKYVKYTHNGVSVYFRLTETVGGKPIYYRDAGKWDMSFEWKDGKLVAKTNGDTMLKNYWDGLELVETTEGEYRENNRGYLPDEDTRNKTITGPTPDRDWNRILAKQMNNPDAPQHEIPLDEEPPMGFGENTDDEFTEDKDEMTAFVVDAGEYFYICDSREVVNEYYYLRALKTFEITAKGRSAYDLVSDLEKDGFVEIIPEQDTQNCLDFAWD